MSAKLNLFQRQVNMTDAGSEPRNNIASTHPRMAHFAGTGPDMLACISCDFFTDPTKLKDKGRCSKFRELMGKIGPRFPSSAKACRHYEAAKKKTA